MPAGNENDQPPVRSDWWKHIKWRQLFRHSLDLALPIATIALAIFTYLLWYDTHRLVIDAEQTAAKQSADTKISLDLTRQAADAASVAAKASGKQADNTAILANAAKDQVKQLETLVAAANKQNLAMHNQLAIMQKQLEITDRPWVGVDVAIKDKIMFSEWVTEWNVNRQISVPLSFSLKNYGASPARNITIVARLLPHPGNARARELDGPQDKVCADSRKQAKEQPITGITIFPDDTKIQELGTGYYVLNANERILYSVLGCVDYTYANGLHGRTAFRMLLGGPFEHGQWSGLPYKLGNDEALTKKWREPPPRVGTINVGTADTFEFSPDPNGGNYAE